MSNLAERGSLGVREPQPSFQLGLQDAVGIRPRAILALNVLKSGINFASPQSLK